MSKEGSRAGVKLGGQAQEMPICGQATFQASRAALTRGGWEGCKVLARRLFA